MSPADTDRMRKRYGEPGLGYGGRRLPGREGYGTAGYRNKPPGSSSSSRFNTFSGYGRAASSSRYQPAYRERTKSAPPPLRRMRSKSEDSSQRRRSSASPWRERRTQTSFSQYCPTSGSDQTYPASALASSKSSRRHRGSERERQSSYYTWKAQSFMDKRFLPT